MYYAVLLTTLSTDCTARGGTVTTEMTVSNDCMQYVGILTPSFWGINVCNSSADPLSYLSFNACSIDQRNCLVWHGVLPPYAKTRIAAEALEKATRRGQFVTLSINNQGDVGFKCTRLTDAIVLQVGLNRIIRDKTVFTPPAFPCEF